MAKEIKSQPTELRPAKARLIARLKADGSIFIAGGTNYWLKFDSKKSTITKQIFKENLKKFRDFVGFRSEIKNKKLDDIIARFKD